jgi:triosephosphate isomerase
MKQHDEKKIEELTADDLEQVVGGASSGTTAPVVATAPVSAVGNNTPATYKGDGGAMTKYGGSS